MPRYPTISAAFLVLLLAWGSSQAERHAQMHKPPEGAAQAPSGIGRVLGQTLYVPVYSHIYFFTRQRRFNLAVTLSIRNTDLHHPIKLTSVRYYNTAGSLLKDYLQQPLRLDHLASVGYVVDEQDTQGGSGANFIVEWVAEEPVTAPVIEAVMISSGTQGVSFLSPGRVIGQRSR